MSSSAAALAGPTTPTASYPPGTTGTTGTSIPPEVADFLTTLNGPDLNIEAPISEQEAREAISLFSVATVLLAGMSRRRVGNEEKTDVLGVLTLFYGLQDNSLRTRLAVNSRELWRSPIQVKDKQQSWTIEDELKSLRDSLDTLGEDVVFLGREARRQFNLGTANSVTGNAEFPRLFKRYVDIAGDALLTLNLREEEKPGSFTSKDKVGQAYDLLAELKGTVLQIVRSLSRYGTIATSRVNKDWALFENRAMRLLKMVAAKRSTEDIDEQRILTVLADVTEKSLETAVQPYIALARSGGQLLDLAFTTYQESNRRNELDNFERLRLLDLLQPQGDPKNFVTNRMRNHALVLKRYPLPNWGA